MINAESPKSRLVELIKAENLFDESEVTDIQFKLFNFIAIEYIALKGYQDANKYNERSLDYFLNIREKYGNPWLRTNLSEWHHRIIET